MRHPAATMKFCIIAVVFTVVGLVFVGSAAADPEAEFSSVGSALGYVLLVLGVINFAVHSVAVLLHDHEMWRSTHFTEIIETED
ncbi:hypothetical protein Rhe02_39240 [Rhizocola hellebori]|uniref:Uncharacterized protein n=1 Tax=Rhizocola hellebori TaxID=1392758 RepID=A0A8J3Q9V2_9ACTN|nr:hypothetical protein [Rhizocola hellebori]GIH05857.1 hypothetical protein Rhe02_39240 [Rhizocola hellebori]